MNLYDFKVKKADGSEVSLEEYKGKVVIIVNTATKCGLTPQYTALQELYAKYGERGLVVLDFPCNQFLKQAPGSDEEISEFCTLNYKTKFPRFAKVDVNGKNADPLFVWLKEQAPTDIGNAETKVFEASVKMFTLGNKKEDIKWNFGKFIIDKNGKVAARFSPAITPDQMEETILEYISFM